MRYYVTHRSERGLAVVAEVTAAVEAGHELSIAERVVDEVHAPETPAEVVTLAELEATEEGRAALAAWRAEDDTRFRAGFTAYLERIRREDEEELAWLASLTPAEEVRVRNLMFERRWGRDRLATTSRAGVT